MDKVSANVCSKINPFLEITGVRDDGYHLIDSIMVSVSASDTVTVQKAASGIRIFCEDPVVPPDETNTCYKAAMRFYDYCREVKQFDIPVGLEITIDKKSPTRAGMGGGSADAAAVIALLDRLYETKLSEDEKMAIASAVGTDVSFCLLGGCARVQGIGEKIVSRHHFPDCCLAIVKPLIGVSTPLAYKKLDELYVRFTNYIPRTPDLMIANFKRERPFFRNYNYSFGFYNVFERVTPFVAPVVPAISEFLGKRSYGSLLCGSGSAVFAVCDTEREARTMIEQVSREFHIQYSTVCRPTASAITFLD